GFTGWYLMNQKQKGHVKCCSIGVKFHGYEMFQTAPELKIKLQHIFLLRAPVKSISKKADVVFSYGGKITDLIKSIGVKPNNIIELSSGIEKTNLIAEIKPSGSKINFLYLGRYERRKGIEELNKALNDLIRNDQKDFTFHFIGNIPEQKKLNSTHVIYHSEIRDKHILQEKIRAADVLICPSYSEGFPNVILEAMTNGLAVAATPVGAVELLVNNTNGWIIENSSSSEIKKVLLNIIKEDKQVIDEKKKSALAHIKSAFIWDDLIQTFLNEIKRFI
ncbi:MAG: glycosyltransferase family 4 protein, partial [Sphingobacteriaceae bacterium]